MITSKMMRAKSGAGNILFNALDMDNTIPPPVSLIIIVGEMGSDLTLLREMRWQIGKMRPSALPTCP